MENKYLRNERVLAWILLFVLSIIWGSSYILIKKGLIAFSPSQVGTMRIGFAFLILLPPAIRNIRRIPRSKWKVLLFTGLVGNLIPSLLFAAAQTEIQSSISGILNSLSPLFTLLIAVFIFGYQVRAIQIAGMVICLVGAAGLSLINASGELGQLNYKILLIVAATFCYAMSLNLIKVYLSDLNSMLITSSAMLCVGPLALTYLLTTDVFTVIKNNDGAYASMIAIAALGIIGTAIALILYTRLIKMKGALFAVP